MMVGLGKAKDILLKKALIILVALVLGIVIGLLFGSRSPLLVEAADVVGHMWLNALRMTVIPLVFTLLIVGIGKAASMARAGRMTARAIGFMIFILWCSSAMAAFVTPALLQLFPLDGNAAAALQSALGAAAPPGDVPPFSEFLRALIPTNAIAAAAEDNKAIPSIAGINTCQGKAPGTDKLMPTKAVSTNKATTLGLVIS